MKKMTVLKGSMLASTVLIGAFAFVLSSCTKTETKTNQPAPTVELSQAKTHNIVGAKVSTTVSVDAPEGGQTLSATVNGTTDANFSGGTLTGATHQEIAYNFTIPGDAVIGGVYTITFQATDKKGQVSNFSTFAVTVSAIPPKTIVEVGTNGKSTYITSNTTWTSDKIYRIHGFVRVGADSISVAGAAPAMQTTGVVLTIQPGTVIYGAAGSPGGTLVVQRGNQIVAEGSASSPIVFTSEKSPGSKKAGDWGGVVLCGKATNNILGSTATHVDGVEELEGSYRGYHGNGGNSVDTDNSGTLKYVRIEFAGYPINPNQEINGLTMGSVGSGTTLSYVQVTYSNDDSFEWFGGAVKADHLIAYKGLDDDFDTDNGYHGQVQFGLGIRDQNIADQSGSNGFESDNDANGTEHTPFTTAVFSNMTIIGGKAAYNSAFNLQFQNVAQIRRNSRLNIINSFFTAYPNGIFVDANLPAAGNTSITSATNSLFTVKNNVLAGVAGWGANGFGTQATADEITALGLANAGSDHPNPPMGRVVAGGIGSFQNGIFRDAVGNTSGKNKGNYAEQQINSMSPINWFLASNTLKAAWNDTSLKLDGSMFEPLAGAPTFLPGVGSTLLTGADYTGFSGLDSAPAYKGAFGSNDWTLGWVNWNPQLTDYN